VAAAPWAKDHRLVRVALKGREVSMASRPASNLVFLIDVSGSMNGENRIGLVKKGLSMLVEQLDARDRVAIVVYAGAAGLVLPPTPGNDKRAILGALDRLEAGGSTNGGQGIELAYAQAAASFVQGGTNRVILASDGDFNVGVSSREALVSLIQQKATTGVFLSVLGFGMNNLRDQTLEQIANKGNGQYAFIDSLAEARKVFVEQATGTLLTIAKDVKLQVTFKPEAVQSFRLIGYENRVMAHQDFANDAKDAGEIGAGHSVTAFYEVVPTAPGKGRLADVAVRFKMPDGATSRSLTFPIEDGGGAFEGASIDFRFGAAVAGFGMKLRGSRHAGDFGLADAARIAEGALGDDAGGHRRGFVELARKADATQR
jgi:Ca-activated chloride channel family protein